MYDYPMRSSIIHLAHSILPSSMMEFFIVLLCESFTNCYTNYHLILGETFCSLTSNFSRLNKINDLYYNVFVLFIIVLKLKLPSCPPFPYLLHILYLILYGPSQARIFFPWKQLGRNPLCWPEFISTLIINCVLLYILTWLLTEIICKPILNCISLVLVIIIC